MPAGTILAVRSGESDQPVAGAAIAMSGSSSSGAFSSIYTSDTAGQFVLDREVQLTPSALVEVTAPGFLVRSTLLRSGETTITLWPVSSVTGLDEEFSSTLAYSPSTCPAVNTGQSAMRKVASSSPVVQVSFGPSLHDADAEAAHRIAIERLNDALGSVPRYEFTSAPGGAVSFVAEIDPNAATCTAGPEPLRAAAVVNFADNGNVSGGRLVYCTVGAARSVNLVLHELGHTAGLNHSASSSDVMYCTAGRPDAFSARERLVMSLARQRRSGNRWPDNDRAATASLLMTGGSEVIACGERAARGAAPDVRR